MTVIPLHNAVPVTGAVGAWYCTADTNLGSLCPDGRGNAASRAALVVGGRAIGGGCAVAPHEAADAPVQPPPYAAQHTATHTTYGDSAHLHHTIRVLELLTIPRAIGA